MSYLLGIDLGTTRTAAAIGRPEARQAETEIVNLGDRSSAVPSVLYVGDDGSVLVGEAAERRAVTSPDHVAREFKRRIGDPTPVLVGGRPWPPEELSARLVRWVVDQVAQREGGPPTRIAITHPASWGPHKKDLLGNALSAQGLPVTFLAEPQAAALHYASAERVEPGSTIAVYDFGGGTFDAAVVHKDVPRTAGGAGPDSAGFSLLGRPEGVDRLGGIDFDEIIFEHVLQGMPEAFDGLDENDPAVLSAVAAIRRECTEAKEALSSDTEVSISVLTPAAQGSVRLHRSEFEAGIQPQVEETVDALRRAISSAGLTPEQLSAVLLVGGSSRIPLIGQLVSEQLGRPVTVDVDPKNAIPMGAALSQLPAPSGTGSWTPPRPPPPRPAGPGPQPPGRAAHGAPPFGGPGAPPPAGPHGPAGTGAYGPPAGTGAYGPGPRGGGGSRPPHGGQRPPGPPPRPATARAPDFDEPEFERVPQRGGRSPGWLVSVGGIAAASAVVAAVILWPHPDVDTTGAATPRPSAPTQEVREPTPEPTTELRTPTEEPEPTRRSPPPEPEPTRPPPATSPPPSPEPTTQPPPTSVDPTTEPEPTSTTEPSPSPSDEPELEPSTRPRPQPDGPGGPRPGGGGSEGEPAGRAGASR